MIFPIYSEIYHFVNEKLCSLRKAHVRIVQLESDSSDVSFDEMKAKTTTCPKF